MLKCNTFLFGLGGIGLNYDYNNHKIITHSKALSKNNKIKLIGAFDKKKSQRVKFYKKYKVPVYDKFPQTEILKKIKLAIICVNTQSHLYLIKKLSFYKNIKLLIIEKPCGKNHLEYLEIEKICKLKKIKFFINYQRIYDKKYAEIYKYIKNLNNFNGTVYYSRGLRNNLGHILSLLRPLGLKNIKIKIVNFKEYPDFIIYFKRGFLIFLSTENERVSNNDFIIVDRKIKIISSNEMNTFNFYVLKKDSLIENNFFFSKKRKIKLNTSFSQKNALNNILNISNKKNKFINMYKDISLILEKIKKKNEQKNNKL